MGQNPALTGTRRQGYALRRLMGALALVMIIALAVGIAGFFRFSAEVAELRAVETLEDADGIVVLTGGKDRIETGLRLLDQRKASRLLISGVHPLTSASAIRVAVDGKSRLFDCCVDIDRIALDTLGNAEEAGKWAHQNGFSSLIVVTSDYHMPRTLMEMHRSNPDIRIVPFLVPGPEGDGWLDNPERVRIIAAEYFKFVAASLRLHLNTGQGTTTASAM